MIEERKYPHTPAPWFVSSGAIQTMKGDIAVDIALMDRNEPLTQPVERDSNCHRIVACVNALDGMTYAEIAAFALQRQQVWSMEWPIVLGWYWFYGDLSANHGNPRLYAVEVWGSLIEPSYIRYQIHGDFMRGHATGVWLPMSEPVLPVTE